MSTTKAPIVRQKQVFAPNLQPGDVVAFASDMNQIVGVFKGWSKGGGNCQVELVGYGGTYVKSCLPKHTDRLVVMDYNALDTIIQQKLKPLIERYKL